MATFITKALHISGSPEQGELTRFYRNIVESVPKMSTYEVKYTALPVAALTYSKQTVTVDGVALDDILVVNPPQLTTGLHFISARVPLENKIELTFYNSTAGILSETEKSYLIFTCRR